MIYNKFTMNSVFFITIRYLIIMPIKMQLHCSVECGVHSLNKYYLNNSELEKYKILFNSHVIGRIFLNVRVKSHYIKLYL